MISRKMNIIVTNYDENWPKMFESEAARLKNIFKDELIDIHHIGSTAVPGLQAKPIIDMMPVVKEIENVDYYNEKMIEFGYEPLGELGIPGRRYFRKGGEYRTHQIHVFQSDHLLEIERHLAVRDYLRFYKEVAEEYGVLKKQLAIQFPKNIEGYNDGKDEFVQNVEQKALAWKRKMNESI